MNSQVKHRGAGVKTSDWLLGILCTLLVPFCLFLLWMVLVADISPAERPVMLTLPALLTLWLLITSGSCFWPEGRGLRVTAVVANGVAAIIGLAHAGRLAAHGYSVEDATLSVPLLVIGIWFFANRILGVVQKGR